MKKILILSIILGLRLFMQELIAQGKEKTVPYISFPIGKNNPNLAYGIIVESMLSGGIEIEKRMVALSPFVNVSAIVVHNIVIKQNTLFGIGSGFELGSFRYIGGNAFFNFRQYFRAADQKFRPMFNVSLGSVLAKRTELFDDRDDLYAVTFISFGGGFRAGHFSFHSGLRYNMHKIDHVQPLYSHRLDAYLQLGAIF
ncbi:MAG: hypothetical protein LBV02_07380 [Bacteroidales bacterium]|jgi:hypothetical protein|nr:hypothetical protein [Bacteroidales bacterium]